MELWAGPEYGVCELCAGLDQVLAVVEDEKGALRFQRLAQLARNAQRQPRLAYSARPVQSRQPFATEQRA